MKNLGKISVIVLFLLSIFVGSFTVYSISKVQSYGTLINYLGIARGATQRLVNTVTIWRMCEIRYFA